MISTIRESCENSKQPQEEPWKSFRAEQNAIYSKSNNATSNAALPPSPTHLHTTFPWFLIQI